MIFLKWEEPVEPNGLITQYEVSPRMCVFFYVQNKDSTSKARTFSGNHGHLEQQTIPSQDVV